jgi:hypothetical protein
MITLRIHGPGAKVEGFRYLWLKSVRAFDHRTHCARCLIGTYDRRVEPGMPTGQALELDPAGAPFLYLCGVSPRYPTNLHLAMRPAPGARAEARTYNGLLVVVDGAEALEIPPLAPGFRGLASSFTTCRNYRFGVAFLEGAGLSSGPG